MQKSPIQPILMVPTSLWLTTSNTWINHHKQSVTWCGDKCPHWENSHSNGQTKQVFGRTSLWQWIPDSKPIRHVQPVYSFMEVKRGHPLPDRKQNWINSICAASDKFWVSLGKTEFQNHCAEEGQMLNHTCFNKPKTPGWEKEGFQRTSSMASLQRVHGCPLLLFKDVCKRDMKFVTIQ